jgi:hypothetical protein
MQQWAETGRFAHYVVIVTGSNRHHARFGKGPWTMVDIPLVESLESIAIPAFLPGAAFSSGMISLASYGGFER